MHAKDVVFVTQFDLVPSVVKSVKRDIFISHASEDKNDLVRELASRLELAGVSVWYDEFSLLPGNSLRESIDKGLGSSNNGLLILSRHFFEKKWPNWELNGLVTRYLSQENIRLIPILHGITSVEVARASPSLADIVALDSSIGVDDLVSKIIQVLQHSKSSVQLASEMLSLYEFDHPPVSNDWWFRESRDLEAEKFRDFYVRSNYHSYQVYPQWYFPCVDLSSQGESLALNILQKQWVSSSELERVCCVTPPEELIDTICKYPGLNRLAEIFPNFLARYAPQLTIKGMGGPFEQFFEQAHGNSMRLYRDAERLQPDFAKVIHSVNEQPFRDCSVWLSLRSGSFGRYTDVDLAEFYFLGQRKIRLECVRHEPIDQEHFRWNCALPGNAPSEIIALYQSEREIYSARHALFDGLVWLLSKESDWLPKSIRDSLKAGLKKMNWSWDADGNTADTYVEMHAESTQPPVNVEYASKSRSSGALNKHMLRIPAGEIVGSAMDDLTARIDFSRGRLELATCTEEIVACFIDEGYSDQWTHTELYKLV